jgi:hypothetical protein
VAGGGLHSAQKYQPSTGSVKGSKILAGARVIWDDTQGINEHEPAALRLAEERSQLARTDMEI